MNENKFDYLAENISGVNTNGERFGKWDENGVSAWYYVELYDKFIGSESNQEEVKFTVDGVEYHEHWFFVNEQHDSSVVGYSLLSDKGDVKFCVIGNRTDFVCDFDTMYEYLTNSDYFVD